ncbi:HD domain-containing protein [Streptomyces camelliae]|uniref:ATP-binding protein n=1 Tax=Streptomyces camelliae TaxID=3004093 RepID=A0ABY7PA74_9ACTN|nr:hypothetical protein [Streptomyces sp. HUAS 2-6]WBO66809.1 hypothetical protein O1G22_30405 [Streptomyces sp. HUAS 2-6]
MGEPVEYGREPRDPAVRAPSMQTIAGLLPPSRRKPLDPRARCDAVGTRPDDWALGVSESLAWHVVEETDPGEAEPLKQQALRLVGHLLEADDQARLALAGDPWQDPDLGRRIARKTNEVLGILSGGLLLRPAEATLLALLPFLYQAHRSRTAADLSRVDPTRLDRLGRGDRERLDEEDVARRESYDRHLRDQDRLVRQAVRSRELNGHGREDGTQEIGWWLFHQWAKQQRQDHEDHTALLVEDLSTALGAGPDRGEPWVAGLPGPEPLARLLSCVDVAPTELCAVGTAAGGLRPGEFQVRLGPYRDAPVRERLVGVLFAIAHAMAVEITALSPEIVWHVGIPEALVPAELIATLKKVSWPREGEAFRLEAADCRHPAVAAALIDHAQRLESLLRTPRQADVTALRALPVYVDADRVRAADAGASSALSGRAIRFRVDEESVLELLTDETLYHDRALAVRELYQNALDACRWRRDRERPGVTYDGLIQFRQGSENGRAFLECEDNGVGMDETVLSEIFSRAGMRFTHMSRYRERHSDTMRPNSRFGVGVFSYFMIADEIEVTTCHMDPADARGLTELSVLITGPGHYFRVRPTGRVRTAPGTTVRLYLREDRPAPSCVTELRRLLGIAEFETIAKHDGRDARWEPRVPRPRESTGFRDDGFVAHGTFVPWPDDTERTDGQVIWCRHGGGVLVDGIFTEPRVRRGILADPGGSRRLRGAVVNLTGGTSPRRLSLDRTEILDDDVCDRVEKLIRSALPALLAADPPLLDADWLAAVAGGSPRLADIVTEAATAQGYRLPLHTTGDARRGHACFSAVARAGFFPPDIHMIHRDDSGIHEARVYGGDTPAGSVFGIPDGATLLWRLLAHQPNAELEMLRELARELDEGELDGRLAVGQQVLPALPSDVLFRTRPRSTSWRDRYWSDREDPFEKLASPGHALFLTAACGMSYADTVSRMRELRLPPLPPVDGDSPVDDVDFALLSADLRGLDREGALRSAWIDVGSPVPPGHLIKAQLMLDISVREAAERMGRFGFTIRSEPSPETLARFLAGSTEDEQTEVLKLLSRDLDCAAPWLDPAEPVRVGHLLRAAAELHRSVTEVVASLGTFGFSTELDDSHGQRQDDDLLAQVREWGWIVEEDTGPKTDRLVGLTYREPVPPGLLAVASLAGSRSGDEPVLLSVIAERLRELGFTPPATLPERAEPGDEEILWSAADGGHWLPAAGSVPLHHVLLVAADDGPPEDAPARLRDYGLILPSPLPGTVDGDDVRLFDLRRKQEDDWTEEERWLNTETPVPLHHLFLAAEEAETEPEEVAQRLRAFGCRLPDAGELTVDELDHRLCVDTFEAALGPAPLPLNLRYPVADFLTIVRHAPTIDGARMPIPELVRRLTRLGVDLRRVTDAIATHLDHDIPGLDGE